MNIVLASDSYFPVISGVTTVVHKTALELAKRKHKVSIVTIGTKARLSSKKGKGVTVFRLPSILNPVRTDHRISIPLSPKMKKAMEQAKPDIIHIHSPGTIGLWILVFAKKHKIPTVATCHGVPGFVTSYFDFLPHEINLSAQKTLWQFYSWFLNQVDHVIAPSEYIKDQLKKNKIKTKTGVLPMWIDPPRKIRLSKEQLRRKWKIPENKTVFLYFGRLDKDKNLKMLIRVWRILMKKYKNKAFLVIAGKGCEKEKLEKIVRQEELADFVKFTGLILGKKIDEICQLSDFFVTASLFETQSIATLQAISYGLPAIIPKSGALTEIAKNFPKYCSTFDAKNTTGLVKKMEKFILIPPQEKHKPAKKFQRSYDKDIVLNKLEKIYVRNKKTASVSQEFISWTDKFIKKYKFVLEELAKK